jgi:glycosyltransferase involved in cell wall biosynthesis
MSSNKTVVISAINFFEGGPLTVLIDCLLYLNGSWISNKFKIVAIVHKKNLFNDFNLGNIEFIELPKSRLSYFYRLYYEFFYFNKLARELNAIFWLSLHDITPNVGNVPQAVYCHNPSVFNELNFSDIYIQPKQFFFKLFYKYLYAININKNLKVIVQQKWIGNEFKKLFSLANSKILIAPPKVQLLPLKLSSNKEFISIENNFKTFIYPAFPRPFKNVELICEAAVILVDKGILNFNIILTLDGTENYYSRRIVNKYKNIENIKFIGLQKREIIFDLYARSNCLIFPSKLETWGLPISEYMLFDKPILVAKLPYSIETIGDYDKACYFDPNDQNELANYMTEFILFNQLQYQNILGGSNFNKFEIANSWSEIFNSLLK